ncbi:oxidoreductase [Corynebacterium auriscanis]|uniref:Oxidoreductase n=2 Tax=Corynebacterium auriscanis TaxID=99807 RepID=A0A0A2DHR1_9CORY|nr:oxidoreductase [Corynebacterium auriscanis]
MPGADRNVSNTSQSGATPLAAFHRWTREAARSATRTLATAFTTPLLPADYAGIFDPLRGREVRGRIQSITHHGDLIDLTLTPGPGMTTTFRPGQFIGLGVLANGRWQWRCFSITDAPRSQLRTLSLGIKPVPDGALSTHVATTAKPGDIVRLSAPGGDFFLPRPVPDKLLFVTAGSGITPVMSMLRWLRQEYGVGKNTGTTKIAGLDSCHAHDPVHLRPTWKPVGDTGAAAFPNVIHIHSQRSEDLPAPYNPELHALAAENPSYQLVHWNSITRGRLDPQIITELVPDIQDRERYVCGPAELLNAMTTAFPGTHVEHFHAATGGSAMGGTIRFLTTSNDAGKNVRADKQGGAGTQNLGGHTETACDGSTTILEAAEACGVQLTHGCRMGICHTCSATITSGQAVDIRTGTTHREGERVRTCSAIPDGDIAIEQT